MTDIPKGATYKPLYGERDLMELDEEGNHYSKHVYAMSREDLHRKSSTAAELGHRDAQIEKLAKSLEWALGEINREPFEWGCEEQADAHQAAVDELVKFKGSLSAPQA